MAAATYTYLILQENIPYAAFDNKYRMLEYLGKKTTAISSPKIIRMRNNFGLINDQIDITRECLDLI